MLRSFTRTFSIVIIANAFAANAFATGGVAEVVICASLRLGQTVIVNGQTVVTDGKATAAAPAATPDGATPMPMPMPDGTPMDPNAKPADATAKPPEGVKIIKRADYLKAANAGEQPKIDNPLDAEGKVRFQFQGAAWPPVVDWLAEISQLSLDWQELPGDVLNLHTQRSYTPQEARDIINRHLLVRGYTLIRDDEMLAVINVKTINPGLVPRVSVADLETRSPYDFVKISLPLDWLIAEDAAVQLAPMLSANGKLSAIKSVNRIEAMDVVANLRDIVALLEEEQQKQAQERGLVREFKLQHVRADEAHGLLLDILGLDRKRKPQKSTNSYDPYMQMQMMQQQMQMMQQFAGQPAQQRVAEPKLIVNSRENSILVHAPPDRMEVVAQTILALDVPADADGHVLRNLERMKVYRLTTLDPEPLVDLLNEVGDLSPTARLRVDEENRSIAVFGSLSDHVTIQALVQKLDGSARSFEVVQLRRLRADEVAGTIQFMLGDAEKKDDNNRSRYSYWYDYGQQQDEKKEVRPFRVDADVENNRLLVWANEVELQEIENLLAKMGETPPSQTNPHTTRVLEFSSEREAGQVLEQLRDVWPTLDSNELLMPAREGSEDVPGPPSAGAESTPAAQRTPNSERTPNTAPAAPAPLATEAAIRRPVHPLAEVGPRSIGTHSVTRTRVTPTARKPAPVTSLPVPALGQAAPTDRPAVARTEVPAAPMLSAVRPTAVRFSPTSAQVAGRGDDAEHSAEQATPSVAADAPDLAAEEDPDPNSRPKPRVLIQQLPDGRVILRSADTRALDRIEDIVSELRPPAPPYHVFHLQYPNTWAFGVELNLKDFFKEETAEKKKPVVGYWGDVIDSADSGPARLSKKKQLKIISDSDSRTILVQGATAEQLKTIGELIELYDQPTSNDPRSVRETQIFTLRYCKASVVADTLKSVYRDLLSSSDPALQNQQQQQQENEQKKQNQAPTFTYVYGGGGAAPTEPGKTPDEQPIRFRGLLSIGLEEDSNSVVVSAASGLMGELTGLIDALDEISRKEQLRAAAEDVPRIRASTTGHRQRISLGR